MTSLLGSAVAGIERGVAMAAGAAADLTGVGAPSRPSPDVATDFVTLSSGEGQVAVGARLARVAQEDQKALLDIVA